ncbi:MAG: hypothetical protein HQM16_06130 [Deltaproteobacteria bacterium]|nr:hypothetical protein [Deltaproteobacteria bacterium]
MYQMPGQIGGGVVSHGAVVPCDGPSRLYLDVQQAACQVAREFGERGSFVHGEIMERIDEHRMGQCRSLLMYEAVRDKAQQRGRMGQVGRAVVGLGHAVFENDPTLFESSVAMLRSLGDELEINPAGFFKRPTRNVPVSRLTGIFSDEELEKRLANPPLVPLSVIHGHENLITAVRRDFTLMESLAIYSRVRDLIKARDVGLDIAGALMGFDAFYELLEIERLYAKERGRPLDLSAMADRLLQVSCEMYRTLDSVPYPRIVFPYVPGSSVRVYINSHYSDAKRICPGYKLVTEKGDIPKNQTPSDRALRSYIRGTLRGPGFDKAVEERARELVMGKPLQLTGVDETRYAVEVAAAGRALHHPAHDLRHLEARVAASSRADLLPSVHSRPFSFDVSVLTPAQQVIDVGLIEEYRKPLAELSTFQAQVEWLCGLMENTGTIGSRPVRVVVESFLREVRATDINFYFTTHEPEFYALIDTMLRALAHDTNAIARDQTMAKLLLIKAVQVCAGEASLDTVRNFRPTMPYSAVVKGLSDLHEIYAYIVKDVAARYFGPDFKMPGKFLGQAALKLEREFKKIDWLHCEIERVRITILPCREELDRFHAVAGDRMCLMGDPQYEHHSLTDPRFDPHRVLVQPYQTHRGPLIQDLIAGKVGNLAPNATLWNLLRLASDPQNLHAKNTAPGAGYVELYDAPASETWRGGIYQMTVHHKGLKIMILFGIDPRTDFFVNPAEFMDGLEKGFAEIAKEGGYDLVLTHGYEGSSRKGTILREILARYPEVFEFPPEDAIGFPLKAPYPNRPPRADEGEMFYRAFSSDFRVMIDLRGGQKKQV